MTFFNIYCTKKQLLKTIQGTQNVLLVQKRPFLTAFDGCSGLLVSTVNIFSLYIPAVLKNKLLNM